MRTDGRRPRELGRSWQRPPTGSGEAATASAQARRHRGHGTPRARRGHWPARLAGLGAARWRFYRLFQQRGRGHAGKLSAPAAQPPGPSTAPCQSPAYLSAPNPPFASCCHAGLCPQGAARPWVQRVHSESIRRGGYPRWGPCALVASRAPAQRAAALQGPRCGEAGLHLSHRPPPSPLPWLSHEEPQGRHPLASRLCDPHN